VGREIAQELKHLDEYDIIHRDIKSDNVLSPTGDIKLSTYHGLLFWYDDLTLAASLTLAGCRRKLSNAWIYDLL